MPVEISDGSGTPHATDYADLLTKLVTFATANGWTALQDDSDMTVLQGEGAGSDEIIVGIQKYNAGWNLNGFTGYTNGLSFYSQPGATPSGSSSNPVAPSMPLWGSSIPYWFIVNSRRIIVVAKVSTTFQMCYLGWMLPYASPGQYPYPMFVGGSCAGQNGAYTGVAANNRAFWSGYNNLTANVPSLASGIMYLPGSVKVGILNGYAPAANLINDNFKGMIPYNTMFGSALLTTTGSYIYQLTAALDGQSVLYPVSVGVDETFYQGIVGDLDGIYFPVGGGSSEDIITVDGDDYLIVQNVFRTAATDITAIKLV